MLTEKCPHCGSFNDVDAAECYFCHKDLPDTPGHKKKRKPKSENKLTMAIPPSIVREKKKNPPGCLMAFVGCLGLLSLLVVFQAVNGAYHLVKWQLPIPNTEVGLYVGYFIQELVKRIDDLLKYPIITVTSVAMLLILCYGLLNLKKWARVLALMLLVILTAANFVLFVVFVMNFYFSPVNNIGFLLVLLGICVNVYTLVWFFEHKKTFE